LVPRCDEFRQVLLQVRGHGLGPVASPEDLQLLHPQPRPEERQEHHLTAARRKSPGDNIIKLFTAVSYQFQQYFSVCSLQAFLG
jgi:hypothetical protein